MSDKKKYIIIDQHGNGFMIEADNHTLLYDGETRTPISLRLYLNEEIIAEFNNYSSWFISTESTEEENQKNFELH